MSEAAQHRGSQCLDYMRERFVSVLERVALVRAARRRLSRLALHAIISGQRHFRKKLKRFLLAAVFAVTATRYVTSLHRVALRTLD